MIDVPGSGTEVLQNGTFNYDESSPGAFHLSPMAMIDDPELDGQNLEEGHAQNWSFPRTASRLTSLDTTTSTHVPSCRGLPRVPTKTPNMATPQAQYLPGNEHSHLSNTNANDLLLCHDHSEDFLMQRPFRYKTQDPSCHVCARDAEKVEESHRNIRYRL